MDPAQNPVSAPTLRCRAALAGDMQVYGIGQGAYRARVFSPTLFCRAAALLDQPAGPSWRVSAAAIRCLVSIAWPDWARASAGWIRQNCYQVRGRGNCTILLGSCAGGIRLWLSPAAELGR